jgi:excinuclease ABC subunit A
VIAHADWVIDLGPEGGAGGGQLIAEGTPEQLARAKQSHTGRYLQEKLTQLGGGLSAPARPATPREKAVSSPPSAAGWQSQKATSGRAKPKGRAARVAEAG